MISSILMLNDQITCKPLKKKTISPSLSIFGWHSLGGKALSIYQFSRHPQSFGSGRHLRRSLMARRRPRVNQESFPRASLAG